MFTGSVDKDMDIFGESTIILIYPIWPTIIIARKESDTTDWLNWTEVNVVHVKESTFNLLVTVSTCIGGRGPVFGHLS